MRIHGLILLLILLLAGAAGAGPAHADSYDEMLERIRGGSDVSGLPGDDAAARTGDAPFSEEPATTVGTGGADVDPGTPAEDPGVTPRPAGTALKVRITCRRTGRRVRCVAIEKTSGERRTCTARRKAAARRRCRRAIHTAVAQHSLRSFKALNAQGFPAQTMPTVGRLLMEYPGGNFGRCSGTVVSRAVVLTAGHCLTSTTGQPAVNIYFLPGATWTSKQDAFDYSRPYGTWAASRWWTTRAFSGNGDWSQDWALLEIPPDASGRYLSDYTGSWSIMPNISFGRGAHIYAVGYPASGWFETPEAGLARGQYTCDSTWDGEWQYLGTGWELFLGCTMNRGASGGPWFVELNDGRWVIGGMNNQCSAPNMSAGSYCDPYSHHVRSSYLDNRFLAFWNDVYAQVRWR